jgi:hypothetical protein
MQWAKTSRSVVGAALMAIVCGCSRSPQQAASGAAPEPGPQRQTQAQLRGAYVPAPADAARALYSGIVFFSPIGYFAYPASCSAPSCRLHGSYVFDGQSDLALTDGITGVTQHIDFKPTKLATAADGGAATAGSVTPQDLVTGGAPLVDVDSGAPLVTASASSSPAVVLEGSMAGVQMQTETDNGGTYCQVDDGVADCSVQGLIAQTNADGSCSCIAQRTGHGIRIPISLVHPAATVVYPTVQIQVGGGAPLTAILDTGSTGLVIMSRDIPLGGFQPNSVAPYATSYGKSSADSAGKSFQIQQGVASLVLGAGNGVARNVTIGVVDDSGSEAGAPGLQGTIDAILGVGMIDRPVRDSAHDPGLTSPLHSIGTSDTFVVSLDGYGLNTGTLIIDPLLGELDRFTDHRVQLLPATAPATGWLDDNVPFCVNSFCGGGLSGGGMLLDSGCYYTMLKPVSTADFTALGVSDQTEITDATTDGGHFVNVGDDLALSFRLGTEDPSGNDSSLSWTFPAPPTSQVAVGLDNVRMWSSAAGNNLGLSTFYRFDVLLDNDLGQIGLASKPVTRICDVKRSLAATLNGSVALGPSEEALTSDNYQAVLGALQAQLGCSTVRVYVDPSITDATTYPQLYKDVIRYARSQLGLRIFASPLGTGTFGYVGTDGTLDIDGYGSWLSNYVAAYAPDYLGLFNQSNIGQASVLEAVAAEVRQQLVAAGATTALVGPDTADVEDAQALLAQDISFPAYFDIFSIQNPASDGGATLAAWTSLVSATARPVWASQDPQPWSAQANGQEVGVTAAVQAGVAGVVLYDAFPLDVDDSGAPTSQGSALAAGIP